MAGPQTVAPYHHELPPRPCICSVGWRVLPVAHLVTHLWHVSALELPVLRHVGCELTAAVFQYCLLPELL
jgi:hypothetical protein